MRIYISGPMTGRTEFNFHEFQLAHQFLKEEYPGAIIYNPQCTPHNLELEDYALIDLPMVVRCDLIVMIADWEESKGAIAELSVAHWLDKQTRILKREEYETPNGNNIKEDV